MDGDVGLLVNHFGPDSKSRTTTGWVDMEVGTDLVPRG